MLTFDEIAAANDRREEIIDVPEWGGTVRLRSFSGLEDQEWSDFLSARKAENANPKADGLIERLLSLCIVDQNGARLFDTDEKVSVLMKKSAVVIGRLYDAAIRLNKRTDEGVEKKV